MGKVSKKFTKSKIFPIFIFAKYGTFKNIPYICSRITNHLKNN